jgi:hypothetical protein
MRRRRPRGSASRGSPPPAPRSCGARSKAANTHRPGCGLRSTRPRLSACCCAPAHAVTGRKSRAPLCKATAASTATGSPDAGTATCSRRDPCRSSSRSSDTIVGRSPRRSASPSATAVHHARAASPNRNHRRDLSSRPQARSNGRAERPAGSHRTREPGTATGRQMRSRWVGTLTV